MTRLMRVARRFSAFLRQRNLDRDFEDELESHLEMLTDQHRSRGLTPEQARRAARIELGGVAQLRDAHREVRGMPLLSACLQDLRYALRTLRRTPGFTATAVLALALGIGATTSVFSLVNAVLLKPAPVPDPASFVSLGVAWPAKFAEWRAQTDVLRDVSANMPVTMNYAGAELLEQVDSMQISADAFRCWGTRILVGRGFTAQEDASGGPRVTLLGEGFWRRQYAGDPHILGRTIPLNGDLYTVIGIAANSPLFLEQGVVPDVYVPLQLDLNSNDITRRFRVTARMVPGLSLGQANARLQAATAAYRARFPKELVPGDAFTATPYVDRSADGNGPLLMVLVGAVGLVLLIACANVANLLLARGSARRRELAIRASIGAGRGRLIRQLLTESLLLSLAGGLLGLPLGYAGIRVLLAVNTAGLPRVGDAGATVALDWRVLVFGLAISLLTGMVFGLFPALEASRADFTDGSDFNARSGRMRSQTMIRAMLVVSEVGLAVTLLIGSALLIRTFVALYSVDLGFETRNVITMRMKMTPPRFQKAAEVADGMRDGLERIRALPGVVSASATYFIPLQTAISSSFNIVGRPPGQGQLIGWVPAASGYFDVFRIPVKRGRAFNDRDEQRSPPVVVINESMARQYWPDADPLKDRIVMPKRLPNFQEEPARQIIGIVGDVRDIELNRNPRPTMYLPQAQITDSMNAFLVRIQPVAWIVRTRDQPDPPFQGLVPAIREQLRQATSLPVSDVRLMDQVVSASTSVERFNMLLMTVFGCAALFLAAIGIHGLMAYTVEQRTREIGIRLALGAEAGDVRKQVVFEGMRLALAGAAIGLALAFALTRFLASFLFGVRPRDPLVFAGVPIVLSLVALLAVWFPASRASRVDPIEALRHE